MPIRHLALAAVSALVLGVSCGGGTGTATATNGTAGGTGAATTSGRNTGTTTTPAVYEDSASVRLSVGDEFIVRVPEAPLLDIRWTYSVDPPTRLAFVDKRQTRAPTGSGGDIVPVDYRFRAAEPGTASLTFSMGSSAPKRFAVTVA
jgi:predicted secreted protein